MPYSHNSPGYHSPYRTLQGLLRGFLFAAHVLDLHFPGGKCPSPSLVLPAAERSTQTWSSAQPVGNHPHRTQPAASHPPSGSLSISIHRAQHPQPLCASHHPQTPTQREGCTRTPAMGLWLPTINTQVSSRLQTPDCCKFCRLNQDQLITSCPHLKSYVVQTKFPEGHLPLWLWPTHSRL